VTSVTRTLEVVVRPVCRCDQRDQETNASVTIEVVIPDFKGIPLFIKRSSAEPEIINTILKKFPYYTHSASNGYI
jgi:lipoate synthase